MGCGMGSGLEFAHMAVVAGVPAPSTEGPEREPLGAQSQRPDPEERPECVPAFLGRQLDSA